MVSVMLRMTVLPDRRDEVLQTVRSTLGRARAVPGCIGWGIYASADETNGLLYIEEWASEEGLARHFRTDHCKNLLAVMEASAQPPELRFVWSDKTCGLEYLEELRRDHDVSATRSSCL